MLLYIIALGIILAFFLLPKCYRFLYRLLSKPSSKKQNKWLDDLTDAATKRRHYSQREIYLEQEIQSILDKLKRCQDLSQEEQLELDEMVKELRDTRLRVRVYFIQIHNLWADRPRGRIIENQEKKWREDEHDEPAYKNQDNENYQKCLRCCERLCGCCAKPRGYDTKGSEIYQHCTFACGCCVRYYGYYFGPSMPLTWGERKGELRSGLALTSIGKGEDKDTLKRDSTGRWKLLDS